MSPEIIFPLFANNPKIEERTVDFPLPLSPTIVIISPLFNDKEKFSTTGSLSPY